MKPIKIILTLALLLVSGICQLYAQTISDRDQKEIDQFELAASRAMSGSNKSMAVQYYNNIATIYLNNRIYAQALSYFNKSLTVSEEINNKNAVVYNLQQIGYIYDEMGDYSRAIAEMEKALTIARKSNLTEKEYELTYNIAGIYQTEDNKQKAIAYYEKAAQLAVGQPKVKEKLRRCYLQLAKTYGDAKDATNAAKYSDLFKRLDDELRDERSQEEISKETEKRQSIEGVLNLLTDSLRKRELQLQKSEQEKEVSLLKNDTLIKAQRLLEQQQRADSAQYKRDQIFKRSVLAVSVLLFLVIILVYIGYANKRKANIQLADRNIEIEEQYTQILQQRDEITEKSQKLEKAIAQISEQNVQITDSINYAKTIQTAMLPEENELSRYLPDSFIFFRPRNIVSGDFYWFAELPSNTGTQNDLLIAAIDCTGHGVPGAFMSLISIKLLDDVLDKKIYSPEKILQELSKGVENSFRQKENENRYGMDGALCRIIFSEKRLEFAGAQNPLIFIQNNEAFLIKGTKKSIGKSLFDGIEAYTKQSIDFNTPTSFYIFSDGFVDQFGGERRSKYMSKRFRALLLSINHLPMGEQNKKLDTELRAWQGANEQVDDILVIGFKI